MAQTAAHLVDPVMLCVPVRQCVSASVRQSVVSLPIPLRLPLAAQPKRKALQPNRVRAEAADKRRRESALKTIHLTV